MRLRFLSPIFFLTAVCAALESDAASLRQCPTDGRYAFSDEWAFCPWCGSKLPAIPQRGVPATVEEFLVLGNIYSNRPHRFSIERPDKSWRFITDKEEINALNPDATVALESEGNVYSMVIVEQLPGVSLDKYAQLVSPSLDDLMLLADETGSVAGMPARKRVWQGRHNDLLFRFYYTLIAREETRFQIVSWSADEAITPLVLAQIRFIEDSFKSLSEAEEGLGEGPDEGLGEGPGVRQAPASPGSAAKQEGLPSQGSAGGTAAPMTSPLNPAGTAAAPDKAPPAPGTGAPAPGSLQPAEPKPLSRPPSN
jgi:rRNA maturation protein Nop10